MLVGGLVSNGVGLLVGLTVGAKVGLDVVGFVVGADVGIGEGRDVEMKFGMEVGAPRLNYQASHCLGLEYL